MSVLGTYILYYFIIISSSVLVYFSDYIRRNPSNEKIARQLFFSAMVISVLISGFRYGIGTDYFSYENIFINLSNSYQSVYDLILNTRFEPGWIIINSFIGFFTDNAFYLFMVCALLTWLFFYKGIYSHRNEVAVGISVLILLSTLYITSFNIVRQILAMSIVFFSIKPLLDRKILKFSITILLASLFHYSSLVFLPAYWIVNSKYKQAGMIKRFGVPLLAIGLIIFIEPILSFITSFDVFSFYRTYEVGESQFGISSIIIRLPVIIIILLNLKKLKLSNNPISRLVILYFLGIILLQIGYVSPYISRVASFFEMTQILIIGAIIKVQKNKYERFLYSYLVIIFYLAWFGYHFLMLGHGEAIPYQW